MNEKELQILILENRLTRLASRGNTITDCGIMRKTIRKLNKIKNN